MSQLNPYLFVYGTLMAGVRSKMARRFHENSRFTGTGQLRGHLFDLGHYPGAVYDPDAETFVLGHIFELTDPTRFLPVLDAYEAVGTRFGQKGEYIRRECPVLSGEKQLLCWVYLYNLPTAHLPRIPSGDYLDFLSQNPNYQNFIRTV